LGRKHQVEIINQAVGGTYKIIYIIPFAYSAGTDTKKYNGPLNPEVLKNWKGTRLPTKEDFFGYCGAKSGDSNATVGNDYYYSSGASADRSLGNYGTNLGRGRNVGNSNYIYLSNHSLEWLSEQYNGNYALLAGVYACSYVYSSNGVYIGYRFRAVFRP
jgi:hypothetical protein